MARTLADLVDAGGLAYAQGRLTRGDTISEVLIKLSRRYPQYEPVLLDTVTEIAQAEERARAEIASASPGQIFGPDQIPFVPTGLSGGYSVDFQFTALDIDGGGGRKRFVRLDFDHLDIAVANLIIAAGRPPMFPGDWTELRNLVANAPAGAMVGDVAAVTNNPIARAAAQGPAGAAPAVNTSLTREAIDVIMTELPLDESADIIFPTRQRLTPKALRKIVEPLLKAIIRS